MSEFEKATSVERTGGETWTGQVVDGWDIGGRPNGGYLLAMATRAALEATGRDHPLAVTGHFLRPPAPGPLQCRARVLREGRSTAAAAVELAQSDEPAASDSPAASPGEGRPFLAALVTAGTLGADWVPDHQSATPPVLPPPQECPENGADAPPGLRVAILDHVEVRLDPATAGWTRKRPGGAAEMRGWVRLRDGAQPDPVMLVLAADILPPVTFELGLKGWVPTVELSVHVRGLPAPGWLRVVMRSRLVQGGWLDEEAEVWDSRDRLVAQARQLAGVRVPRS